MLTRSGASEVPRPGYASGVDKAPPARVLVVDGNASLAGVLAELIDDEPGFAVVGKAVTGEAAVRLARSCAADVVLVDERLDDALDSAVLHELRTAGPEAVILLWSYHEVHTAAEGVDGLLQRGMTFRVLVREMRRALRARHASSADARSG